MAAQTTITARSGPLPPAEELLKYEQIAPGCTERLLKMVENQSAHRIQIESLVIASQQKQSARGQIFGLVIGLTGILAGATLAYLGHDWVGGIIAGSTVTGLVSVFVIGKNQQNANLARKRPQ
jgi:uncharacterized membrane protein